MIMPKNFRFSQASLQDYLDCRRRFFLRYVNQLAWPAIKTEPALERERLMRLGAQFHKMIHQHLIGIDKDRIEHSIREIELQQWWNNYLEHPVAGQKGKVLPEHTLTTPLLNHRLVAKFDLLTVDPGGSALIVDWKTSKKVPKRTWLAERMQTKIYRYVLVEAGNSLNDGSPIEPENIAFVYWFANHPGEMIRFDYSRSEHNKVRAELEEMLTTISNLNEDEFSLTDDESRCAFCAYRSLCDRGITASEGDEPFDLETLDDPGFDFDIEQVGEVAF